MRRKRTRERQPAEVPVPYDLLHPDPAPWPSLDAMLQAREAWARSRRLPAELIRPWREDSVQDSWPAPR
jgi:hypothetical protein